MKHIILATLTCLFAAVATAQDFSAYQKQVLVHRGDTLPYRILYPENYDPDGHYPILFFLHGSGERGNDNEAQLIHGGTLFISDTVRKEFPAIVVFPQCPADSRWSNMENSTGPNGQREFHFNTGGAPTPSMRLLLRLVNKLVKEEAVDQHRIYVGGLSMGGMGTYEILRRKPKLFAAAFAICGGDNTANVRKYSHVPLWIFHGELDTTVPPIHSRIIIEELKRLGATPRYTFYPTAEHNSWDQAFAEPDLFPWLLSNHTD